jgi:uncharacterized damage-inducible protein DinB
MTEIQNLGKLLQRVYTGKAWHGPCIMDVLKDVDDISATKKVGESHSIIQLVLHMASWRTFVSKRLLGDTTFELSDDDNFPSATTWAAALHKLEVSQAELLKAIDSLTADMLNEQVANRKYDYYVLLHGIIHHDIYHIGQILLIKKYVH